MRTTPIKEFQLSVLYSQDHAQRLVSITAGDHEVMGRIIKRDASRLKWKEVDEALGLFDGGPWIDAQMVRQQIPLNDKCLDDDHVRDNIPKTRREIFGDTEAGRTWAQDLAETFQTQGFIAGFNSLVTLCQTLRSPKQKPAATRLVNGIRGRLALIISPEFRPARRNLGSGPTEAQCKCETLRIKGHGRRWNKANALAISTLEAVHQSRLTEKFWNLMRP